MHHGDAARLRIAFQDATNLEAADVGKFEVEQHEVGPVREGEVKCRAPAAGLQDLVPRRAQRARLYVTVRALIVDVENGRGAHAAGGLGAREASIFCSTPRSNSSFANTAAAPARS